MNGKLFICLVLALCAAPFVEAQSTTSLYGTVTDNSGGVDGGTL
jgi:hypothetical protein